jgi:CheY-like chemotaxis protein
MKFTSASPAAPVYSILLIGENRHGLIARRAILDQAGYATTTADHPDAGLEEFARGDYDLVITSFKMPGMNGDELITRIRRIRPGTLAIMISGFAEVLGLNEQNTGADAVIPKSANEVSHMMRTVNRLLRSKAPRKPAMTQPRTMAAGADAVKLA